MDRFVPLTQHFSATRPIRKLSTLFLCSLHANRLHPPLQSLERLPSSHDQSGRKVRIRFRGTNLHKALLFAEALPELTALWRSLQIMRAHLVKRLKNMRGEMPSGVSSLYANTC